MEPVQGCKRVVMGANPEHVRSLRTQNVLLKARFVGEPWHSVEKCNTQDIKCPASYGFFVSQHTLLYYLCKETSRF